METKKKAWNKTVETKARSKSLVSSSSSPLEKVIKENLGIDPVILKENWNIHVSFFS